MKNMTVVITMAGAGSRFKAVGYTEPKYEIIAHQKSLLEWWLHSLQDFFDSDRFIFIVQKQDNATSFIKKICAKLNIASVSIMEIDGITDGQATTAMVASEVWTIRSALLIYNIDTYVEPLEINYSQIKGDGFIPCFAGAGDHWSFVKVDSNNRAIEVREKVRISENCTVGAYYFKTCELYEKLYREYYVNSSNMEKKEKYVAPLYNHLIAKGGEVYISIIKDTSVHVLGTPDELKQFLMLY